MKVCGCIERERKRRKFKTFNNIFVLVSYLMSKLCFQVNRVNEERKKRIIHRKRHKHWGNETFSIRLCRYIHI